ncbi:MAG TPA: BlaI/MecI/CopY family transcriptional regulator [Thermoanaerobaculia bacterium]|jgi:predicted transcriptional regulator
MPRKTKDGFSRRERQIMDIVYGLGEATAAEIHERLPDPPTYTAVRGLLRVLVDKGHLEVEQDGVRYLYRPVTPREAAGASLLSHVVDTFFGGSAAAAMAALVGSPETRLSTAELDRLARIVEQAREAEEKS